MKRRIILFVSVFMLCAGIVAGVRRIYTAGYRVDNSENVEPIADGSTKVSFTTAEFLADYDKLWEVLEENYYYFPYLEKQGVDVGALQYPQTQAIYAYLEEDDGTGAAGNRNGKDFPDVGASYDDGQNAVVFTITSFDDSLIERDRNFVREYIISLGDVEIDHIIFDLSGNRGGSDFYWQDNIVAPFGGRFEWTDRCYLRDTELLRSYFFHDYDPEPISSVLRHEMPAEVEEFGLTHYFEIPRQISVEAKLGDDVREARRWVITDEQVYSSADSFVAFCRETGWATVTGKTTRGDGKGVSPILVSLPETGILVRFSGMQEG